MSVVLSAVHRLCGGFGVLFVQGSGGDGGRRSGLGLAGHRNRRGTFISSKVGRTMSYIKHGIGTYGDSPVQPYWPYLPTDKAPGHDDCGCGGTCGGCGDHGMGFFTNMDPSTWGLPEWGTVAAGGYVAMKALAPAAKRGGKRAKAAASKGASSLGNIALLGAAAYAAWWAWNQYQTTGGLGDYMPQGYVNPQRLLSPIQSAAISIPRGW
jgi:hypothetical protein